MTFFCPEMAKMKIDHARIARRGFEVVGPGASTGAGIRGGPLGLRF